jgi:hypothetical protein
VWAERATTNFFHNRLANHNSNALLSSESEAIEATTYKEALCLYHDNEWCSRTSSISSARSIGFCAIWVCVSLSSSSSSISMVVLREGGGADLF